MPTARARTNRTKIGRWVGAATAALALALLFGGLAAPSASAQTRQQAVDKANKFIAWCFAAGGTPNVVEDDYLNLIVTCYFPGGATYACTYWPTVSCTFTPLTRPPTSIGDQLGGEGGVATSDPSASAGAGLSAGQGGGIMNAKAADAAGHDQPATHQHGAKPKPGKAANHQKSHAEKK